jgi:hypothetical protein
MVPSIYQGAIGYLVALFLAISFRHVIFGMAFLFGTSRRAYKKLQTNHHSQKAMTLTNVRLS